MMIYHVVFYPNIMRYFFIIIADSTFSIYEVYETMTLRIINNDFPLPIALVANFLSLAKFCFERFEPLKPLRIERVNIFSGTFFAPLSSL